MVVDETQAVPAIVDAVQHLSDRHKRGFRFVLSGSSARKLRVTGANLLTGRSPQHRLHPLTLVERAPGAVHGRRGLVVPLKTPSNHHASRMRRSSSA